MYEQKSKGPSGHAGDLGKLPRDLVVNLRRITSGLVVTLRISRGPVVIFGNAEGLGGSFWGDI